jgi:hypothetical protein
LKSSSRKTNFKASRCGLRAMTGAVASQTA